MIMNEGCNDKWENFISGGRIVDYLEYKGISCKELSKAEGSQEHAYYNKMSCYIITDCSRK